jgi:hypothetical protein
VRASPAFCGKREKGPGRPLPFNNMNHSPVHIFAEQAAAPLARTVKFLDRISFIGPYEFFCALLSIFSGSETLPIDSITVPADMEMDGAGICWFPGHGTLPASKMLDANPYCSDVAHGTQHTPSQLLERPINDIRSEICFAPDEWANEISYCIFRVLAPVGLMFGKIRRTILFFGT